MNNTRHLKILDNIEIYRKSLDNIVGRNNN